MAIGALGIIIVAIALPFFLGIRGNGLLASSIAGLLSNAAHIALFYVIRLLFPKR